MALAERHLASKCLDSQVLREVLLDELPCLGDCHVVVAGQRSCELTLTARPSEKATSQQETRWATSGPTSASTSASAKSIPGHASR